VASGHATLATKRTLLLTWAGLSPAGSHQLCGWRTYSITSSEIASNRRGDCDAKCIVWRYARTNQKHRSNDFGRGHRPPPQCRMSIVTPEPVPPSFLSPHRGILVGRDQTLQWL